jgi:c-di-GMP-binding flagellar brake protein YcgR
MNERRKSVRVDCRLFCGYDHAPSRRSDCSEVTGSAVTQDLSEGGARLVVFEFLPVGRHIRVHLEIPRGEPVETVMEVLWVNEIPHSERRFEIGGRFTTLADDQRSEIRRFVCTKSIHDAA